MWETLEIMHRLCVTVDCCGREIQDMVQRRLVSTCCRQLGYRYISEFSYKVYVQGSTLFSVMHILGGCCRQTDPLVQVQLQATRNLLWVGRLHPRSAIEYEDEGK